MISRGRILFLRQIALALVTLFATAGVGLASQGGTNAASAATSRGKPAKHVRHQASPPAPALTVPQVERRPYVFVKGLLEEAGFAWRVVGPVRGFPANFVVSQNPRAGTAVVDNGAPTITLVLERNPTLAERGVPIQRSPYHGTPVVSAAKS